MEPWTRQLLSVIVSQLCKTIGWHSISTTCLQVLVDVLHRYLKQLSTNIHEYTEHYCHKLPALEEINLAFGDMGINVDYLKEYVNYVTPITIKHKVPKYPLEKKSNLNFLKPGSREVVTRPVHIHEYLPAMYPEMSDENYPSQEGLSNKNYSLSCLNDIESSISSYQKSMRETPLISKHVTRVISEEIGRPLRELGCVMMTSSGFLSPAREGKGPEARLPKLPNTNNTQLNHSAFPNVPPEVKGDHKKSHPKSSCVKSNERKIRDEPQNNKEEVSETKVKKLAGMKELSKLKAFKPILNKNDNGDNAKMSLKQEKLKTYVNPPSPKEPKPIKLPTVEKVIEKTVPLEPEIAEKKLTTEPNKQKLNIFKRISKVKEERLDSPQPRIFISEKNTVINDCVDVVVKRGCDKNEPNPAAVRERELEITLVPATSQSPSIPTLPQPQELSTVNVSHELTVEAMSSAKHVKRKKKQKNRNTEPNKQKIVQRTFVHMEPDKPKQSEPEPPPYPFFKQLHPGLMPPSLSSNLLIPRLLNPFMNITKSDPNCPHPEMPNLPLPPATLMQANIESHVKTPMKFESEKKAADNGIPIVDKKQKKKMKKDKREKDKKKREKKDKLLKKQEKLTKKKDLKRQQKFKTMKNKKLKANVLQAEEPVFVEDTSLPKLKLKITGSSSPQLSPSDVKSPKIVIKPIVKQEEVHNFSEESADREGRGLSPELAKIAFISKPAKQKNIAKVTIPEANVSHKSLTETAPALTVNTKSSKKNQLAEIKTKNKEKSRNKKVEEVKPKPAAYYYDAEGNQVWICPACGAQDDGSPMIGCDGCDAWYHWVCVGIKSAPDSVKWFCGACAKTS